MVHPISTHLLYAMELTCCLYVMEPTCCASCPHRALQLAQYLGTNYEALFLSTPLFFAAWPAFWTALSFVRGKFGSNNQETEIY
jgi:hypothetical protein